MTIATFSIFPPLIENTPSPKLFLPACIKSDRIGKFIII